MQQFKNIEEVKSHLNNQIQKCKETISTAKRYPQEEVDRYNKAIQEMDMAAIKKYHKKDLLDYSSALARLKMFEKTMDSDLIIANKRYISVTHDCSLMSPAGIHPSQKVFIKVKGMEATNIKPKIGFDMVKISNKIDGLTSDL